VASVVSLTDEERRHLRSGRPVTSVLDVEDSNEVAVFGAIWIDAPIRRYVKALEEIETFERGPAFTITRRISDPPVLEDFAQLRLPEEDVEDLRTCRVGDCDVKLGEEGIKQIQAGVDWNAPNPRAALDPLIRQLAFKYVTGYLQGGNERLAQYRDKSRPRSVAKEFREMIDQTPELTTYMPEMRRYLLGYPKVALADTRSFVYWQETKFGLKPTIRISHLTIREGPDDTAVASKMLYASHYFRAALELRGLHPDPSHGAGFWYVIVNRSRADGLTGLTGLFVRPRVRSRVREGTLAALQATKRKLEDASPP